MTSNINMWTREFDTEGNPHGPFKSEAEDAPVWFRGCCEGVCYPIVNYRRVTGSKYTPYRSGSKAWREAANRALAQRARSNFERGKR